MNADLSIIAAKTRVKPSRGGCSWRPGASPDPGILDTTQELDRPQLGAGAR